MREGKEEEEKSHLLRNSQGRGRHKLLHEAEETDGDKRMSLSLQIESGLCSVKPSAGTHMDSKDTHVHALYALYQQTTHPDV